MEIIHTDAREERVKYILIVDKIYRRNLLFRLHLWCQWIKSFKKWSNEYTIKVLHYVELGFHYTKSSLKVLKNFVSSLQLLWSSDQDTVSPYKIHSIPSRQVMRIKKNINQKIITWSNTKFSKLTEHQKNCMTVS